MGDFDLGGWNMEMVHELFDEEESKLILGIPLSLMGCKDRIIWHHTKHGGYTVRTGHKVAMELQVNGEFKRTVTGMASGKAEGDRMWKGIWGLHVLKKIKFFMWRCCNGSLVVRRNLLRRCMNVDVGQDFRGCWEALLSCIKGMAMQEEILQDVVFGLWRIWKCKNDVVFQEKAENPMEAIEVVRDSLVKSKKTGTREDGGATEGWRKPKFRTLKVNCDGSWNSKTGLGSYGWVIRDFVGYLRRARRARKRPFNSAILAEAESILATLVFCKNEGFMKVEIESNARCYCE
ncbi:uncharacterized protein [Pyrus communis]|uniref:uncharacterized protein n=1 Tax=Pyrus communis TaxID=23211 RepID=UPI0035C0F15C